MNKATKMLFAVLMVTLAFATTAKAQSTLFFSEYLEGSSNNKALEIYNPTDAAVDLSNYRVYRANNGSAAWQDSLDLVGSLAAGDVYVIGNSSAVNAILNASDTTHTITFFNGDDALALVVKDGENWTTVDAIGTLGEDPGSAWDVAGVTEATNEQTLVRKPSIMAGNSTWTASAGSDAVTSEWMVLAQNDTTMLGFHNVDMTATITNLTENVAYAANFDDQSLGLWAIDNNPDYGVGGVAEVSADIAASGDFSLKIVGSDTLEKSGIATFDTDGLGIQVGDTLYFRVWVSEADTAKFDALQPYTQSGTDWSQWSDDLIKATDLVPNTWNWIKVGIPAPKDDLFQKAGLQVTGNVAEKDFAPVVYVDDITVVRPGGVAPEAVKVTFVVNTSTMADTMFTDHVLQVRGGVVGADVAGTGLASMVTWDSATLSAENAGGDYWNLTFDMSPGDTMNYKFWAGSDASTGLINGGEQGWESGDNNQFILSSSAAGDTTVPVQYYETRTAPFTTPDDSVNVYFRVNVGAQLQVGDIDPATDVVGVRGFPEFFPGGWDATTELSQGSDTGNSLFYEGAVKVHKDSVATLPASIGYKFVIETSSGTAWESTPDRTFSPTMMDTTLNWVYFSDTPPSNSTIVDTNLNFEVNVGILEGLGLFNSSIDTVNVTGTFNNWNNSANKMLFSDFTGNYEGFNIPITAAVGSTVEYKYFIRWDDSRDDEGSANYLANISATGDGWEEPGATGGGNRVIEIEESDNQPVVSQFWNGVAPEALMLPTNVTGGEITVTFSIDMAPALDAATAFVPATDSVFLSIEEAFFALTQDLPTYVDDIATRTLEERNRVMFTDDDEDLVYELELTLQLPTLNQFAFNIAYGQPTSVDGVMINTGPGGTASGRRFYQYVQPDVSSGSVVWPTTFKFPTLTWTDDPLEYELPPAYVTSNEEDTDVAGEFRLEQNYPNPFNPTTNISFALPNAASVRLTVYNVLGQEVATLINGKTMTSGSHAVAFNASALSSGMYIYRLEAGNFVSTKRMMLIK